MGSRFFWLAILAGIVCLPTLTEAQASAPACGQAPARLESPEYVVVAPYTFAVETPAGWAVETKHKNPFYVLLDGDTYAKARTLIYVNVERLDGPLREAVVRDEKASREDCPGLEVVEQKQPALLEAGCEARTQLFVCRRAKEPSVELVTKIAIGGLLLNVVLHADNRPQLEKRRKDFEFLLVHLALVVGGPSMK